MKKFSLCVIQNILTVFTIILLINCKPSSNSNLSNNNQVSNQTSISFSFNQKQKSLVSAHRGGVGIKYFPENCIETMQFLYEKGIQIFEIDLAMTKDQKIILMHDNSLQRTSTGLQDVNQVNLKKIKEYSLIDNFGNKTTYKIPTLKETLQWAKNKNVYFMIDFKKDVPYENVIAEIRKLHMEKRVILISYTLNQAKKLHNLAPEMYLSVPMKNEKEFTSMINSNINRDKMLAFTGTNRSPKSLHDKIHQENIMVIFGTLGNIDKSAKARGNNIYQNLEDEGVDIFATDRALEVFETLK